MASIAGRYTEDDRHSSQEKTTSQDCGPSPRPDSGATDRIGFDEPAKPRETSNAEQLGPLDAADEFQGVPRPLDPWVICHLEEINRRRQHRVSRTIHCWKK